MINVDVGATYNGYTWEEALEAAIKMQRMFGISCEEMNYILEANKDEVEK